MPTSQESGMTTPRRRCPGRKDKGCSSFIRDGSPHRQCQKCRRCSQEAPCHRYLDKDEAHWARPKARGKHGDRANRGKVRAASLETEDQPKTKDTNEIQESDRPCSKDSNGKSEPLNKGPGASSEDRGSAPDTLVSLKCLVPGFPATSRRYLDGSLE